MAELPFPWCIYAEHQSKAAASGRVDHRSWGSENGLNTFLRAVESGSIPENNKEFQLSVDRAVATGCWVERNHARLRLKYIRPQDAHPERQLLARLHLAEIRAGVSPEEWNLLLAVAVGIAYQEMAGATPGSARTRVARLRARLRQAVSVQAVKRAGIGEAI